MKEALKKELENKIYGIIFNKDLSINEQKSILNKYFKKYNGKYINELEGKFKELSIEAIERMILAVIQSPAMEKSSAFERHINWIAEIILKEEAKKLI